MTSGEYRRAIQRAFGYQGLPQGWAALLDESLLPRGPQMLYDVAGEMGLGAGDRLLDAGCRDASHTRHLVERYGCRAVGVDIVERGLLQAEPIPVACGDLEALPFADTSFDFVWSRDVLEMVEDPLQALRESCRVLRPGGGLLLYVACATDALEPLERGRLFTALDMPVWEMRRDVIEDAIARAGFAVERVENISPEWLEHDLEEDAASYVESVLHAARMLRARERFENALGGEWYERLLAWSRWSIYLSLGKIQTVLWVLRAPG